MPTGHTQIVLDGANFEEFARDCANSFCAVAYQDAQERDVQHHAAAIEKAERQLRNARKMSFARAFRAAAKDYNTQRGYLEGALQRRAENCFRLSTVLVQAAAYQPPSEQHVEFKQYMIGQLADTIRMDGNPEYYAKQLKELRQLTPQEYKARDIKIARSDITYHLNELDKAQERSAYSNQWVSQFRKSLPAPGR